MANEKQQSASQAQPQSQSQAAAQPANQREVFVKHLEHASSVVKTWPAWKQQVLGGAAVQPAASAKR